ncbi:MAG: yheS 5 [Clostridia bacterium]|jgi:lincosamide and streptogramin A transport system ATP-binding/permease protein|nr:yheS 5 [Clostridia bacterium]
MSKIQITNLSFGYEKTMENVFENVFLNIDTDWKLGLIGRNGKGKTTFLNLLLDKFEYDGSIIKTVDFDYFPFEVKDKSRLTLDIIFEIAPFLEDWQIIKELNILKANPEILYRNFNTLSGGEQVKVLLASLFLKENNFLLIDEPTNHLDNESRKNIQEYLNSKKGFILVSHDRELLDNTVDHILAINNFNVEIQKGTFSTWKENKENQDNFEMSQNKKLKSEITRLETAVKNTSDWSDKVEASKIGEGFLDKGYIGHQAAKMMQRSKAIEKRKEKAIKEKSSLLKNIDRVDDLTMKPLEYEKELLLWINGLSISYGEKVICKDIRFELKRGDRISLIGKNGSGKSTILKLINGEQVNYTGTFDMGTNIKISYVSQTTENLKGTLKDLAKEIKIDEGIFKSMLFKLGVSNSEFDKDMQEFSEGQKKKVLIAKSITESADLYIWDEPLNFIDIQSRVQIENVILKYKPTMIFVEHDETFVNKIATKKVEL